MDGIKEQGEDDIVAREKPKQRQVASKIVYQFPDKGKAAPRFPFDLIEELRTNRDAYISNTKPSNDFLKQANEGRSMKVPFSHSISNIVTQIHVSTRSHKSDRVGINTVLSCAIHGGYCILRKLESLNRIEEAKERKASLEASGIFIDYLTLILNTNLAQVPETKDTTRIISVPVSIHEDINGFSSDIGMRIGQTTALCIYQCFAVQPFANQDHAKKWRQYGSDYLESLEAKAFLASVLIDRIESG
jgi:hypothetical protein